MTRGGNKGTTWQTVELDTAAMPLAGRMQRSLVLGDLAVLAARWAHGQFASHVAARAERAVVEQPTEPCCGAL